MIQSKYNLESESELLALISWFLVTLEALLAIHWLPFCWLERNLALLAAIRALGLVHFPWAAAITTSIAHLIFTIFLGTRQENLLFLATNIHVVQVVTVTKAYIHDTNKKKGKNVKKARLPRACQNSIRPR